MNLYTFRAADTFPGPAGGSLEERWNNANFNSPYQWGSPKTLRFGITWVLAIPRFISSLCTCNYHIS